MFRSLCFVFLSKSLDEKVLFHINILQPYISDDTLILDIFEDEEEFDDITLEIKDSNPFKEKSPFERHFVSLA